MKNSTFVASALSALMLAACQTGPKVVENPLIESANSMTLDIAKVELTDTATVLHVDAYFRPHYWIRIDSKTYLRAEGKNYALTDAQGITPDSLFWMPESGEASFVLSFQPLPKRTKSFDFIESDCADCFKLFGIDLTGKQTYDTPEDIPAEALEIDGNAPMPEPVFKSGETTVEVRLLHHRKELGKVLNMYVNDLTGTQEEYAALIDSTTDVAVFKFKQYGPAMALLPMIGNIQIAPGEHATVYVDQRASGQRIVSRRKGEAAQPFRALYVQGTYANLNNLVNSGTDCHVWSMNLYDGKFADYKMTSKAYAAHVIGTYKALSDSIAADSLPPLMKEWMQVSLQEEAVAAMLGGNYIREHNYRYTHDEWNRNPVKGIEPMKPEDQAEICKLFDVNNPRLLMGSRAFSYIDNIVYSDKGWMKIAGIRTGLIPSLQKYALLVGKAQNGVLTPADLKELDQEDDAFYAEALEAMQQSAVARLEAVKDKAHIEPIPDVPLKDLFDAIVAPYKGKVVLVDFWNTWCGPCRAAIKATEPLKDTELKNDNLVWIYIANETSPIVKYKTMIPDIKGKHFRLNDKQWEYLAKKFKIDGIPSYVLVDKDGSYRLRNDLRDHDLLCKTLAEKSQSE